MSHKIIKHTLVVNALKNYQLNIVPIGVFLQFEYTLLT